MLYVHTYVRTYECMFLHSINSTVGTELLLSMLQHLAGLKMSSVLPYLREYLKMIQLAAQFQGIPVNVSLYLQDLVHLSIYVYAI